MNNSARSNVDSITSAALKGRVEAGYAKPILPPILCQRDKNFLEKIRIQIDLEKERLQLPAEGYSPERFAVYSQAFDAVIENVTVYKDILSDVKQEYEQCITAITNGQKESLFLQSKIKTLAHLPSAIEGHERRKIDLQEKLTILNSDNEVLEARLKMLRSRGDKEKKPEEREVVSSEEIVEDEIKMKPIPGLTVEQWTHESTLTQAVIKLDSDIREIAKQRKTNYVPISKKIKAEQMFGERLAERKALLEEGRNSKAKNQRMRLLMEAMAAFKRMKERNPEFEQDLTSYITHFFSNEKHLLREKSLLLEEGFIEDDDPSKEKEAEMILEYIDKFNELFAEGEFPKAAVHAANSPRAVLRAMETLNRFKSVSESFVGTPTPLLMYAEALMHSSAAQSHVCDKEMTLVCCKCALTENRPDLVEHWMSKSCITTCEEIGDCLVKYGDENPQERMLCLAIAERIYSDAESHANVCYTLYTMGHLGSLLDYAKNVAHFTKIDYLELIRKCPDPALVWNLCRPSDEMSPEPNFQPSVLPLRFDEAVTAMLVPRGSRAGLRFLDDLHTESFHRAAGQAARRLGFSDALHRIVYDEAGDDDAALWSEIAESCFEGGLGDVAMEIEASVTVKRAVVDALKVIAQDEKEEFDYYT